MTRLRPYPLAAATFFVVAAMAALGLINTWRWYSALPAVMAGATLPTAFWLSAAGLAVQFIASLSGLGTVLSRKASVARNVALGALSVLLLVHLSRWALLVLGAQGAISISAHALRAAFAIWLALLLYALAPNKSFKPNPLRGSA